ncbi:hypothetical protein [Leptolyngbya sp. O-77]|uniref:hypothetical protein n=1 Tax=Leptolyngbya sp. O-77 TaxID=1080068 RepID=UPI00074D3F9F|nr:hypothetical protein [Leptolyngbya sp. O-77]BAU41678.1 hypothetical protein O77CONTIG1_01490 [Leptolyngbya sp. O-77]
MIWEFVGTGLSLLALGLGRESGIWAIAGTEPGSGLGLLCVRCAVGILLIGVSSLKIAAFREAETRISDCDSVQNKAGDR